MSEVHLSSSGEATFVLLLRKDGRVGSGSGGSLTISGSGSMTMESGIGYGGGQGVYKLKWLEYVDKLTGEEATSVEGEAWEPGSRVGDNVEVGLVLVLLRKRNMGGGSSEVPTSVTAAGCVCPARADTAGDGDTAEGELVPLVEILGAAVEEGGRGGIFPAYAHRPGR